MPGKEQLKNLVDRYKSRTAGPPVSPPAPAPAEVAAEEIAGDVDDVED